MISLRSLITENFQVIDLRDPNWIPSEYAKKDADRTMININRGNVYLYRWGNGNKIKWEEVIIQAGDFNDMMMLTKGGSLILPNRVGGNSTWEGARNIYTESTKEWVDILLKTGIINDNTNVYVGNWAGSRGDFIGKAKHVVKRELGPDKLPSKLVFYHGTSSDRLETIQREGLKPVPLEMRPWKSDVLSKLPEYREHAIYLTFDIGQADYYARKSVNVARRQGIRNTQKVVLKVTIPRKFFRRLLPDDDYLMQQLLQIGVTWIESLKNFSQVAYLGAIPPEWIEVKEMSPQGWRKEPDIKEISLQELLSKNNEEKDKRFLSNLLSTQLEKDKGGNVIHHRIWFKNIFNPLLRKMGYVIVSKIENNKVIGYEIRKKLKLTEKQLLMEMTNEQSSAAIDFLKKMVSSGPFKGKVYLAGGPVRDMVMGKTPKDLDTCVENLKDMNGGIEFTIWLAQQMGNYKEGSNPVIFPKFGTAKVFLSGNHNGVSLEGVDVESVNTRKEVYEPGNRKPEVFPGTIQDDVFRRDFNTNSLLYNLTTGETLDITGHGVEDIKAGILRTTSHPDEIFMQDPLRMLRAIRFMVQKGWRIDPMTESSIQKNASWLETISAERIQEELNRMLVTTTPAKAMRKMHELGVLKYIIPDLERAVGVTQNVHHSEDVFSHILTVVSKTKPILIRRLGALLHDIGKVATRQVIDNEVHFYSHEEVGADIARKILIALKYPNDIVEPVVLAVKSHMRTKQSGREGEKISDKSIRKLIVDLGNHLDDIMDIVHADNTSHSPESSMPNQIPNILKRIEILKNTTPKKNEKLPITGNDLKLLGLQPGPLFGQLLDVIRDKQLENPNTTKEEYLDLIRSYLKNNKI